MKDINKENVHKYCLGLISEKISGVKVQIKELGKSFENETKSSAGDKHETARAMAQLESEKLHQHLFQLEKQLNLLNKLNISAQNTIVQNGSLVKTESGYFYISIPLGIIDKETNLAVISLASPVGKLLHGKSSGEIIEFNKTKIKLVEVS